MSNILHLLLCLGMFQACLTSPESYDKKQAHARCRMQLFENIWKEVCHGIRTKFIVVPLEWIDNKNKLCRQNWGGLRWDGPWGTSLTWSRTDRPPSVHLKKTALSGSCCNAKGRFTCGTSYSKCSARSYSPNCWKNCFFRCASTSSTYPPSQSVRSVSVSET